MVRFYSFWRTCTWNRLQQHLYKVFPEFKTQLSSCFCPLSNTSNKCFTLFFFLVAWDQLHLLILLKIAHSTTTVIKSIPLDLKIVSNLFSFSLLLKDHYQQNWNYLISNCFNQKSTTRAINSTHHSTNRTFYLQLDF